jgi:tRNA modification GTPase
VTDNSSPQHLNEERRLLESAAGRNRILVRNKSDLGIPEVQLSTNGDRVSEIRTSAISGEGIGELRAAIIGEIGGPAAVQQESGFVTNLRQRSLLDESLSALSNAEDAVHNRTPHEMLMMDLHSALQPLDAITGQTTNDDILNLIFSTFCIGK